MNRTGASPESGPDTSHDHEWPPREEWDVIFEDEAAILIAQCEHETVLSSAKGYEDEYIIEDSIACKERRRDRFEAVSITRVDNDSSELSLDTEEPEDPQVLIEEVFQRVAGLTPDDDVVEVIDLDRDGKMGHALIRVDEYEIRYEAE